MPNIPGEACTTRPVCSAWRPRRDTAGRARGSRRSFVGLLRMAFTAGFGKDPFQKSTGIFGDPVEYMEADEDLVAVHDREDYRKLLDDLRRKP